MKPTDRILRKLGKFVLFLWACVKQYEGVIRETVGKEKPRTVKVGGGFRTNLSSFYGTVKATTQTGPPSDASPSAFKNGA